MTVHFGSFLFLLLLVITLGQDFDFNVTATIDLLEEGTAIIEGWPRDDYIVTLGITGAGKSTLCLFVTQSDDRIEVVEDNYGNLIFNDTQGIISNNTFTSHTLIPNQLYDYLNHQITIDNPGFDDTRGITEDIAANYFIRISLLQSFRIKLLLAINFVAVQSGSNRDDFIKFLRTHAIFIKDVDKYKQSILLTVTKVDDTHDDVKQITYIANYILDARQFLIAELENTPNPSVEYDILNQSIQLTDIFTLKNSSDMYERISLFRKPDQVGPISESTYLMEVKQTLRKFFYNNFTLYLEPEESDFEYALSTDSQLAIQTILIPQITQDILNNLDDFQIYFDTTINEYCVNFTSNTSVLKPLNDISIILNLLNQENDTSFDTFFLYFNYIVQSVNGQNESFYYSVLKHQDYIEFFQTIPGISLNEHSTQVVLKLKTISINYNLKMANFLTDDIKPYLNQRITQVLDDFMTRLNKLIESNEKLKLITLRLATAKLILYQASKDYKNFAILISKSYSLFNFHSPILKDLFYIFQYIDLFEICCQIDLNNALNYEENFSSTLQKLEILYQGYDLITQSTVQLLNPEHFDSVLNGITSPITRDNINLFLAYMQQFFNVSSVITPVTITDSMLFDLNSLINYVSNKSMTCDDQTNMNTYFGVNYLTTHLKQSNCSNNYNNTRFFIINSLKFDTNLILTSIDTQVTMIASFLRVNQSGVNIDVSGVDGEDIPKAQPSVNASGTHGKPGNPGAPGGNFLGIFLYTNNFTIRNNGGNGGPGQNGGNGGDGSDGKPPDLGEYVPVAWITEVCDPLSPKQYVWDLYYNTAIVFKAKYKYYVYDGWANGQVGYPGGNGGQRGLGARPGNVTCYSPNIECPIETIIRNGYDSYPGYGGEGGHGGRSLKEDLRCEANGYLWYNYQFFRASDTEYWYEDYGVDGKSDDNYTNVIEPRDPSEYKPLLGTSLNELKIYLRSISSTTGKFAYLSETQRLINFTTTDTKILQNYLLIDFANHMESLENQRYQNQFNIELKFAEFDYLLTGMMIVKDNMPDQNGFNIVYAAIRSEQFRHKYETSNNLIVDLLGEIQRTKEFANSVSQSNKLVNIDSFSSEYKQAVDDKINEANNLIIYQVLPQVDQIETDLLAATDVLLLQVAQLENDAKDYVFQLQVYESQLSSNFASRIIFSTFNLAALVVSFVNPVLGAVGIAITGILSLSDSAQINSNDMNINFQVPESVYNEMNILLNLQNDSLIALNTDLADSYQLIQDFPTHFTNLRAEMGELQTYINENIYAQIQPKVSEVRQKRYELRREIKEEYNSLDPHDFTDTNSFHLAQRALGEMQFVMAGDQVINPNSVDNLQDKSKIDLVNDAIDNTLLAVEALQLFRDEIFYTLKPLIESIYEYTYKLAETLEGKSLSNLDFLRAQTNVALQHLGTQFEAFVSGFPIEAEFRHCFINLQESINLMLQLAERIATYEEQKIFAEYVADLNSADNLENAVVTDENNLEAINRLKYVINANIFIDKYNRLYNAFIQQVFPFANSIGASEFELIETGYETMAELVSTTNSKLTNLEQIILEGQNTIIQDYHEYIRQDNMNISKDAIFYWHKDQYNTKINDLLSGKQVALNADIYDEKYAKNALKFTYILFQFVANNSETQAELNEALKLFEVRLIHSGNAHMKCDNEFVLAKGESQNLVHSFEMDPTTNRPKSRNLVHKFLDEGDYVLSPYTTWLFQIAQAQYSFGTLEKYKGFVDVKITGNIQYVERNAPVCAENITKYFL